MEQQQQVNVFKFSNSNNFICIYKKIFIISDSFFINYFLYQKFIKPITNNDTCIFFEVHKKHLF